MEQPKYIFLISDLWYPIKDFKKPTNISPRILDDIPSIQPTKKLVPLYHYYDENELAHTNHLKSKRTTPNDLHCMQHSNTSQIIEELRSILTEQLEESKAHSNLNHHSSNNKSEDKSLTSKDLKLVSTTHNNSMNVKEMPLNPFDFIWYANNLVPKQDEAAVNKANLLEAMYEEYALYKSKSMLSDQKSNNNNWSFSEQSSNNPLFSDDYTISSRASKCDPITSAVNIRKKKDKKFKLKKKKAVGLKFRPD